MRSILFAAGVTLALFTAQSAQAQYRAQGPWCAVISFGIEGVQEDCSYASIEECRPNVVSGNRGFCRPNANWQEPAPRKPRRKRG
ncbi:MAG: DUF3551 domain-containing protein [Pseudolabrys sp.]|nr:DUF3551 domain-containing protein [Pseudolabrys sp.]MBV9955355.1 DUF3551 domain-containing protein [Pseudolabrys sp.]